MKLSVTIFLTWNIGILLLAFVALQLRRRKLEREFPFFTLSVWFHLIVAVIGLWVYTHLPPRVSVPFFWAADALDGPISLFLIYEIFSKALSPYPGIRRIGRIGYGIGIVALTVIGVWMCIADPRSVSARLYSAAVSINRSLELIRVGLLLFLFAVHRFLGLNWRHYVMGIAIGMGISSALGLMNTAMNLQTGFTWWRLYAVMAPFSYDIGLAFWAYYFATSESKVEIENVPYSAVLERWNSALQEMTAQ